MTDEFDREYLMDEEEEVGPTDEELEEEEEGLDEADASEEESDSF
jgi:hypothetical protein